jgi:hypothetical protein
MALRVLRSAWGVLMIYTLLFLALSQSHATPVTPQGDAVTESARLTYDVGMTQMWHSLCSQACASADDACLDRCMVDRWDDNTAEYQVEQAACDQAGGIYQVRMAPCENALENMFGLTSDSPISEALKIVNAIYMNCSAKALCFE